jgi:hydrogenase maturation factor
MTPEQKLLLEQITAALSTNSNVGTSDYVILHTIFWVSIIASASAALLTAIGKGEKWMIAVLAALPALCLTVENTFSFTTRYSIRNQAVLDLKALKRDIELKNTVTTSDGVDRLNKIESMVSQSPLPRFATTDTKQIPSAPAKQASTSQ